VLEGEVRRAIAEHGLGDVVTLSHTPDLSPVLARTRLFVSTQAYENFTSLAMLEAMAAGNAVVAANVGQTAEFVQHGVNGLLTETESPEGFARAITDYLQRRADHAAMGAASARLATEVHTVDHFADDITDFWKRVTAA
jgi:glycosyltransferase involved in cell wall biosynthesis